LNPVARRSDARLCLFNRRCRWNHKVNLRVDSVIAQLDCVKRGIFSDWANESDGMMPSLDRSGVGEASIHTCRWEWLDWKKGLTDRGI
jgi:hypothetical protein